MLRLSRRGIILSLVINALNIAIYLIVLVAACLNIVKVSVNFIILNTFAASFAALLIISEIWLPQLTYKYFRFLCTYRGRGLTYLFFGCLVASRIPFNLYGSIIVVCMGIAFFMLSYVRVIPPLDGLILNYKKLGQWKEQKHFCVQQEAQRIFEQQLQQEQNPARVTPAHHPNSISAHAHLTVGSSKQIRAFQAMSSGSASCSGGAELGRGEPEEGALTSMFSPPLSPSQRPSNYSLLLVQSHQQGTKDERLPPHRQFQNKLCDSNNNFGPVEKLKDQARTSQEYLPAVQGASATGSHMMHVATGRGKGHMIQNKITYDDHQQQQQQSQPPRQPLRLNKSLPPILTSDVEDALQTHSHAAFSLSSPPVRRPSATSDSVPESPLQYLYIPGEDPLEAPQHKALSDITLGAKPEWKGPAEQVLDDHILKSTSHAYDYAAGYHAQQQQQQQQQYPSQQLPLRTANKPAPPHDPFRKTSVSLTPSTHAALLSNLVSATPRPPLLSNTMQGNSALTRNGRTQHQSPYHQPDPLTRNDRAHLLHQTYSHESPTTSGGRSGAIRSDSKAMLSVPLTATSQILSSIGGISGRYGVVGAVPGAAALTSSPGMSSPTSPNRIPQQHQQRQASSYTTAATGSRDGSEQDEYRQPFPESGGRPIIQRRSAQAYTSNVMSSSCPQPQPQPQLSKHHQQEGQGFKSNMPDIVLTLPSPAEPSHSARREGNLAM
ncbi:hypothetical protein EDD11_000188 [Mortierella claussenii]|nr:hypothetical protein EDD11_000188 [Mortierella claussenii]